MAYCTLLLCDARVKREQIGIGVELFAVNCSGSITNGEHHGKQRQEKRIKGQEAAAEAGARREIIQQASKRSPDAMQWNPGFVNR